MWRFLGKHPFVCWIEKSGGLGLEKGPVLTYYSQWFCEEFVLNKRKCLYIHIQFMIGSTHIVYDWISTYSLWLDIHIQFMIWYPHTVCDWISTYSLWLEINIQFVIGYPNTVCDWISTYSLWWNIHIPCSLWLDIHI